MAGKVQIVAMVDPHIVTQLDTLRIFGETSRARVMEPMIGDAAAAALAGDELAKPLARLKALAKRAGATLEQYVDAYARAHSRLTYGPGLDELETDDSRVRAQLIHEQPTRLTKA